MHLKQCLQHNISIKAAKLKQMSSTKEWNLLARIRISQ